MDFLVTQIFPDHNGNTKRVKQKYKKIKIHKSEDPDFQGYQSLVDSQEGRMSLKNSQSGSSGSAKTSTSRKSPMPAMPSMKSLMFKEEEFTIGFWPGCQAPDLKEVPGVV